MIGLNFKRQEIFAEVNFLPPTKAEKNYENAVPHGERFWVEVQQVLNRKQLKLKTRYKF